MQAEHLGGSPSEQAAINQTVVALRTLERAIATNDAALAMVAQQTAFRVYDAIAKRVNAAFPSARELRRRERDARRQRRQHKGLPR